MKKAIVVHPSINMLGGAERVSLGIVSSLRELGIYTVLFTIDKTKWDIVRQQINSFQPPNEELFLVDRPLNRPVLIKKSHVLKYYFRLLLTPSLHTWLFSRYDLVISSYGEILTFPYDVVYVNSIPLMIPLNDPEEWVPELAGFKNVYTKLYKILSHIVSKGVFITNSKFLARILYNRWGISSLIVHPPVEPIPGKPVSFEDRRDIVVTVSRIKRGKRLDIIPYIAKYCNVRFIIIGSSVGSDQDAMARLYGLIEKLGVRDKVKLLLDLPRHEIYRLVKYSKVYLHTMRNEAFGISIAEAMSAGTVPVVPRSGGPWTDIIGEKNGVYGYSYDGIGEACCYIRELLGNKNLWKTISANTITRSRLFSRRRFIEKIKDILGSLI